MAATTSPASQRSATIMVAIEKGYGAVRKIEKD